MLAFVIPQKLRGDALDGGRRGLERVLGGLCAIAVTLNPAREVVQLAPMQSLNFGEREKELVTRALAAGEGDSKGPAVSTATSMRRAPGGSAWRCR